jgi:hypothetical protein
LRIFYVNDGLHTAGGQMINLEHVASLRAMGFDARFLILRNPGEAPGAFTPSFPPPHEGLPWQRTADDLAADDYVVLPEMFGRGFKTLADTPARRVIHNQNPYYTFGAFPDLAALERWGCKAIIAGSEFGAGRLKAMGWRGPVAPVRVFVDPLFAQDPMTPRPLQVAFMPRKRAMEARLVHGILSSLRPDLADVPWVALADMSRVQVAEAIRRTAVFLSMSWYEGLGLPPLEALAAGTLVVGYHGYGGLEYATPENGDWFEDERHVEIAQVLAARLDAWKAGETFEARRRAGAASAAAFSRERFEAELRAAWEMVFALG